MSEHVAVKTCTKCETGFPATVEFFYQHPTGRHGLTPRCKPCTDADNRASSERRRARDPERVRAQQTTRTKRHYHKDLEASRQRMRAAAAKQRQDPEKRAKINMRKRGGGAGMSPEEFQTLLTAQGGCCAICGTPEPPGTLGWNIDHCHRTGAVRFILCSPCNRGLGAFRDDPVRMRKAADLIEQSLKL